MFQGKSNSLAGTAVNNFFPSLTQELMMASKAVGAMSLTTGSQCSLITRSIVAAGKYNYY